MEILEQILLIVLLGILIELQALFCRTPNYFEPLCLAAVTHAVTWYCDDKSICVTVLPSSLQLCISC